ncbi:outer membrane lipoprotein-sorting protein [Pseudoalteromonas tunicata]|uniref:outer membrane lipoprotein-sorting protein n=1 Tax=Pseudoalteromonas tunicata TaxID=314281 RepID=UPI00273F313E|nr:outer membrane lipoprotein-sorting protein [Pseudoalteromonas tunicata]MDP4982055.1 outer membrane lipoprotein-sorting protein [Pseudoalteromonas tunicata]MDP5213088.1 outer membrane lipoprotein-sorting protein [Pseudoalteromonas tunicata]
MKKLFFIIFIFFSYHALAKSTEPLGQWIDSAERILRAKTSASVLTMDINKADFQRDFVLQVLTDDRNDAQKVMVKMLGPALWRGNVTLKVDDRISFFEPRNKRTTVMSSSMLASSWMGSHFSNDDLMRETDLAVHYSYELEKSWQSEGREHHLIALSPLPSAPVVWGKVQYQLYLEDGRVFPEKVTYFRRAEDTESERTLSYSDVQQMDGFKVPTLLEMRISDKPDEYTRMQYKKIKFNTDLAASKFTEQAFQ